MAAVLLVAATGWSAAGCAGTTDGFGTPRQPSPGAFPGPRQDITGVVAVQGNGCLDLDLGDQGLRWIVWPDTTTDANDGATVVVGDHSVSDGDVLTGTGTLADASVLPGWDSSPVGYLGDFGRYCGADETGIVVLDEATVTSKPITDSVNDLSVSWSRASGGEPSRPWTTPAGAEWSPRERG